MSSGIDVMNLTPEEAAEIADRAHVASWGGVGGAGLGWLMSDTGIMLLSLLVAALSAAISIYYRRQRDKRERAEHARRMEMLDRRAAMYGSAQEVMESVHDNSGSETTERQRVAMQALREVEVTETEFSNFEDGTRGPV